MKVFFFILSIFYHCCPYICFTYVRVSYDEINLCFSFIIYLFLFHQRVKPKTCGCLGYTPKATAIQISSCAGLCVFALLSLYIFFISQFLNTLFLFYYYVYVNDIYYILYLSAPTSHIHNAWPSTYSSHLHNRIQTIPSKLTQLKCYKSLMQLSSHSLMNYCFHSMKLINGTFEWYFGGFCFELVCCF